MIIRGKNIGAEDEAIRGEMAKAAQMISDGVRGIISIFPSVDLTDREREVHVTQYAHKLAMAMAVAEMFKREEIDFGPTYKSSIDELAETITDDLKENPYVKV